MYFLAQCYGVLGFVQSQPDNGNFATTQFAGAPGQDDHNPWVQGKALSIYASVSWFSALLAVGMASLLWRLPRSVNA